MSSISSQETPYKCAMPYFRLTLTCIIYRTHMPQNDNVFLARLLILMPYRPNVHIRRINMLLRNTDNNNALLRDVKFNTIVPMCCASRGADIYLSFTDLYRIILNNICGNETYEHVTLYFAHCNDEIHYTTPHNGIVVHEALCSFVEVQISINDPLLLYLFTHDFSGYVNLVKYLTSKKQEHVKSIVYCELPNLANLVHNLQGTLTLSKAQMETLKLLTTHEYNIHSCKTIYDKLLNALLAQYNNETNDKNPLRTVSGILRICESNEPLIDRIAKLASILATT